MTRMVILKYIKPGQWLKISDVSVSNASKNHNVASLVLGKIPGLSVSNLPNTSIGI